MCGIVGYIGNRDALPILLAGLRRLEYRGYDSAGIGLISDGEVQIRRATGKIDQLTHLLSEEPFPEAAQGASIAHTRWATHGSPTTENAHPHLDYTSEFACVHNGIIENSREIREQLERDGHTFTSETDSEVIPQLIKAFYEGDLVAAVAACINRLEGTYGVAIVSKSHPDQLIVARRGSPIVIGVGEGESIVASDVSAIVGHTAQVMFLEDDDIAVVTADSVDVRNVDNVPIERRVTEIDWDVGLIQKGGHEHFMLKEILEQPEALRNTIRGRLDYRQGTALLSGLNMGPIDLATVNRIVIAACGTSMHAGMVSEYFFEDLAAIPTEVEQAAEFRYRNPIIDHSTLVIAISQSGETADTLAALREAQTKGAQVVALCNVVGSTIAREAGRGIYLHAGPEIGVASTKAFTCQVTALLMMAMKFARTRRMTREDGIALAEEIERLPDYVQKVLDQKSGIEEIAIKLAGAKDSFFIGRGCLYPVALEGALKLKEISYAHAEGYHAAELKHGPIALLQDDVPVVALANDVPGRTKILTNIQECRARHAPVIVTATEGDEEVEAYSEDVIWIPRTHTFLTTITTAVALQLLAYYVARERGCDIDQPRNLAKSVTVE
jgi:glucosamine--fructose-6-phosphate aminotransferase (isomerizing)